MGPKVLKIKYPNETIDVSKLGKGLFVVEVEIEGVKFREKLIKD